MTKSIAADYLIVGAGAMGCEWPKGIHVTHLVINSGVDTAFRARIKAREGEEALANLDPNRVMPLTAIADAYGRFICSRTAPGSSSRRYAHLGKVVTARAGPSRLEAQEERLWLVP